ncbi:MAG: hypothetical protein U0175_37595 [Caldilineaceae bacterium]
MVTALAQASETHFRARVVNDLLQRRQIIYGDLRQQRTMRGHRLPATGHC